MKIILPLFITFFAVASCSQVTIDKKNVKGKTRYFLSENGNPISKEFIALDTVLNYHTDGSKETAVPNTFIGAYSTAEDTLYQMLDSKGKILLDLLESDITFWDNQGFALKNNKWGIVNTKGAVVRNFDLDRADNLVKQQVLKNCCTIKQSLLQVGK